MYKKIYYFFGFSFVRGRVSVVICMRVARNSVIQLGRHIHQFFSSGSGKPRGVPTICKYFPRQCRIEHKGVFIPQKLGA